MGKWLTRLAALHDAAEEKNSASPSAPALSKLPKPSYVSSGSGPGGGSKEISGESCGPTFEAWASAANRLCDLRRDRDSARRQALLDDYADLAAKSRVAWLGVFRAEIAAIVAVHEATA